ncbi:MAG UNVERIFIED_CONTAM: sigma-70 family RNA polymerase sigma factor [Planctomycetaceae bacterium]
MSIRSLTRSSFLKALATQGPDAGVWNDLDRRYGDWIFGWCRRWGASESDAEDLTQETLVRVYRHIQNYQHNGPCSFRAWIRTVARTTWLMLLRHRSRRPRWCHSSPDSPGPRTTTAYRTTSSRCTMSSLRRQSGLSSESFWMSRSTVSAAAPVIRCGGPSNCSPSQISPPRTSLRCSASVAATVYLWNTRVRQKLAEEISTLTNH